MEIRDGVGEKDLRELADERTGLCISLYQPVHRVGARESREDAIRFKNLLGEAEELLARRRRRSPELLERLGRVRWLIHDEGFWKHQGEGLAVFLSPQTSLAFRLSIPVAERVILNRVFHLLPLLPLTAYDRPFYVLTVSQHTVRLWHGTRDKLRSVTPHGLPESLEQDLWYRESDSKLMERRQAARPHTQAGSYHGLGEDTRESRAALTEFLRHVENVVSRYLERYGRSSPLILAGTEPTLGIYRRLSSYPELLPVSITEKPELLDPREVHRRGWEIVRSEATRPGREALFRYFELAGNRPDRTTTDLELIAAAAREGRVETVLVTGGEGETFYQSLEESGEGILDEIILHTLLHGGAVFPIESGLPGETAAILRY